LFLQRQGIKLLDSLHLALAEEYRQDVLLTTDDVFLAAARRIDTGVPVVNPVVWLMEKTQ
jgi:predicted nucleic acid-binding protein